MDYNRNKKYFEQHLSTAPVIVSAACIAIGFMMVVILSGTRGFNTYMMISGGLTFIAIGAAIFLVRAAKKIPDNEISEQARKLYDTFKNDFNQKFLPQDIRTIRYEMANHISRPKLEPVTFATYCFEGEEVLAKKGNDGKSRSSIYSMSGFILKPDSICVAEREISLISDNDPIPGDFREIKYIDLGSATLEHVPEKKGYEGFAKYRHLRLCDNDGKIVIEFPIIADAAADDYVKDIAIRIQRAKEKAAKEAE
jgi:hypothetical protein